MEDYIRDECPTIPTSVSVTTRYVTFSANISDTNMFYFPIYIFKNFHTIHLIAIMTPSILLELSSDESFSNLSKLRDSGILQRLRTISWPQNIQNRDNNWTSVNVYKVVPIVLLLATGATLACVILGVELLMHRSAVTKTYVSASVQEQTEIRKFWELKEEAEDRVH
uniref:Uncharacterized protein n=1 Tax=Timema poppense TaxID=170557 RepID=A0A7R9DBG6_TIMPO|nr:unnamed protein product [Timema poppensis]